MGLKIWNHCENGNALSNNWIKCWSLTEKFISKLVTNPARPNYL